MNPFARLVGSVPRSVLASLAVGTVLLCVGITARADVPGRVGRIAFLEGDVQAYSETDPQWKVAYVNQPITSRNSLFVGDAGRAEISVGSTTLAMDAGSQVDIQQLDDNTFNANVVRGRVSMRVRRFDPSDVYNVASPDADFALLRPGRYRIDALESSSGLTVFEGQAAVQTDASSVLVNAGESRRVTGNPSDANAAPEIFSAAPSAVALDDWVLARESRFRDGVAERYVSPNMTGYEDLDANGRWSTEADVGPVWYPTTYVQTDWAPYRYGRWAYVAPWGYTWIDDAPWGFAPFHYGRWLQVGNRWGWAPGAYVARPAYAPALVGFYGGSGFSASFSVGAGPAVGWYPLAPWQRYAPHYTQNAAYINRINNITVVEAPQRFGGRNGGRDWNRDHGGTIVPQGAFASQRSISRVAEAAPRGAFDRAPAVGVVDLPRPAGIPGAVRRGPEGNSNGRPDFRSPREFASRPEGGPRPFDSRGQAPAILNGGRPGPAEPQAVERSTLPPGYRRLPEQARPADDAVRAIQPGAPEARSERFPRRNGPDAPSFNREVRSQPQPQQAAPVNEAPAIVNDPSRQRRFNPQQPQNPAQVVEQPRPQVQPQGGEPERQFQRPNREFRNMQPPPQAQPQPVQPQAIERPQRERPAPAIMQAPAAVAPAAPPPRPQPPVAQPQPQPQAQPRAQPQRAEPPAGGEGRPEGRGPGGLRDR